MKVLLISTSKVQTPMQWKNTATKTGRTPLAMAQIADLCI
jgi:hypothetical protein